MKKFKRKSILLFLTYNLIIFGVFAYVYDRQKEPDIIIKTIQPTENIRNEANLLQGVNSIIDSSLILYPEPGTLTMYPFEDLLQYAPIDLNGQFETKLFSAALAQFKSLGYEPIINYYDNQTVPDGSVFGIFLKIGDQFASSEYLFQTDNDVAYLKPDFKGTIILDVSRYGYKNVESTNTSPKTVTQSSTTIESKNGLTFFGTLSNGMFAPVELKSALAAFRAHGYEPKLNYEGNSNESNGYVVGLWVLVDGKQVSGDYIFAFNGNDIYIKPGFTGAIQLNINTQDWQSTKTTQTNQPQIASPNGNSIEGLTYFTKRNNFCFVPVFWSDALAAFRSQGYEPELNFEGGSNESNGYVICLNVFLGEGDEQVSGDYIYTFQGDDIYIKPGFEGRIRLNINTQDWQNPQPTETNQPQIASPQGNSVVGLTYFTERNNFCFVPVFWSDAQSAFQSQGYEPELNFEGGSDTSNGYVMCLNVFLGAGEEQGSGDYIFTFIENSIYIKPGFGGRIRLNINTQENIAQFFGG